MKNRFIVRFFCALLLCFVIVQAFPVLAADGKQTYTLTPRTAEAASFSFQAEEVDFSVSDRYYDQLSSEDQKNIYNLFLQTTPANNQIEIGLSVLPELSVPAEGPDEAFQNKLMEQIGQIVLPAYAAALLDTPMLFWTDSIHYTCSITYSGTKLVAVTVCCTPLVSEQFSAETYDADLKALQNVLASVSFTGETRREMLKQFHDYLCNTIVYADSAYAHNAFGALTKGEAVCEGYAKSFKLFCDLYDIPCMLIIGTGVTASENEAHAWNSVRMEDGKWYGVDVTWDDQDEIYYDFFLVGSDSVPEAFNPISFSASHVENNDFYGNGTVLMQSPTLSKEAYVPNASPLYDVDNNGSTDSYDVTVLLQYLAGIKPDSENINADTDGDGRETVYDCILLQQYLAGM